MSVEHPRGRDLCIGLLLAKTYKLDLRAKNHRVHQQLLLGLLVQGRSLYPLRAFGLGGP